MMPIDEKDFDRVYHAVFGNGSPGMDEQLRVNTRALDLMKTELLTSRSEQRAANTELHQKISKVAEALDQLVLERRDADNQRLGQVRLFNGIRTVLIILSIIVGIGAPLGMWRISSQWSEVQQQIQRIPALPE